MYYKTSDSSHQKRSNQTKTRMMVGSRILESDWHNHFSRPLFSRSQSLFSGVKIVIAHQTILNVSPA